MRVQLARMFGGTSREASASTRTPAEWRRTFGRVLVEIERYLDANVNTDELHYFLLMTCIWAGLESLKEDEFIIGYAEAVTRLAFLLMGDYPDHRRRKTGVKRADHYELKRHRSVAFSQNQHQKLNALNAAFRIGYPQGMPDAFGAFRDFRPEKSTIGTHRQFLLWFRGKYPKAYAGVF